MINTANNFVKYTNIKAPLKMAKTHKENVPSYKLVSDKRVASYMGYGVDKGGFFTSDFNEKAGLPKDFKIHYESMKNYAEYNTRGVDNVSQIFSKIDIAKTAGNAYRSFIEHIPQKDFGQNYSREDIAKLPFGYKVNEVGDYSYVYKADYDSMNKYQKFEVCKFFDIGYDLRHQQASIDNIFLTGSRGVGDMINLKGLQYKNGPDKLSKGGLLIAYMASFRSRFLEGESSVLGKLWGTDKSMSKMEQETFYNYLNANCLQFADPYNNLNNNQGGHEFIQENSLNLEFLKEYCKGTDLYEKSLAFEKEYTELVVSDLSTEDFIEKYMDFKKRHDGFIDEFKTMVATPKYQKMLKEKARQAMEASARNNEPFKPIEGKSHSKTYEGEDVARYFFEQFIKAQEVKGEDIEKLLEALEKRDKAKLDISV